MTEATRHSSSPAPHVLVVGLNEAARVVSVFLLRNVTEGDASDRAQGACTRLGLKYLYCARCAALVLPDDDRGAPTELPEGNPTTTEPKTALRDEMNELEERIDRFADDYAEVGKLIRDRINALENALSIERERRGEQVDALNRRIGVLERQMLSILDRLPRVP